MRLPYFLTADGRETVRGARSDLERHSLRVGLGVNASRQAENQKNLQICKSDTRQKLFAAFIAGTTVIAAAGATIWNALSQDGKTAAAVPMKQSVPVPTPLPIQKTEPVPAQEVVTEHVRGQKLLNASKALEKTELCSVQWHHPEGHEGEIPTENGMIVVFHVHQNPHTGAVKNNEHLVSLYKDLQILYALEEAGMRDFHFEGGPSDKTEAATYIFEEEGGENLAKEDHRKKLKDKAYFMTTFDDFFTGADFSIVDSSFAATCFEDTQCHGSENPATFEQWLACVQRVKHAEENVTPMKGIDHKFHTQSGNVFIVYEYLPDNNMRGVYVPHEKYIAAWEEYIAAYSALKKMASEPREQYIAQHLDGDVVLMGGYHSTKGGLPEKATHAGRSLCVVKTNYYQQLEAEENIQRNTVLDLTSTIESIQDVREKVEEWKARRSNQ